MNPPPLSFRIRVLLLAIVAIAWLAATRDAPNDVDARADVATPSTSQVVATGKTSDGERR